MKGLFPPLHFQPAHGSSLSTTSSPVSPMTRLLRADQTLFRDPDVFELMFVPDHLHHRDTLVRELLEKVLDDNGLKDATAGTCSERTIWSLNVLMSHWGRDSPEQFKDTMFMFVNPYTGVTKNNLYRQGSK